MKKIAIKIVFVLFLLAVVSIHAKANCSISGPSIVCVSSQATYISCEGVWSVGGAGPVQGSDGVYTFNTIGTYTISLTYQQQVFVSEPDGPGYYETVENTAYKSISVIAAPSPVIDVTRSAVCDSDTDKSVTLSVSNPEAGVSYSWYSSPTGLSGTGISITYSGINSNTVFYVRGTSGSCSHDSQAKSVSYVTTNAQPILDPSTPYHKRILNATAYLADHYWQNSADGQALTDKVIAGYVVTNPGNYYIRRYSSAGGCWTSASQPVNVTLNYIPPTPVLTEVKKIGYCIIYLTNDDKDFILQNANYYWVSELGTVISPYNSGSSISNNKIYENGRYFLRGQDVGTGTWSEISSIDVTLRGDDNLNWVSTQTFDGTFVSGTTTENIASSSTSYFDEAGNLLQSQTVNMTTGQVLASDAPIKDKYGRAAVSSLPAPTNRKFIQYRPLMVTDASGNAFDYHDFEDDSQYEFGSNIPGTVGWYYSSNNTLETNVAKSGYPYSRTQYYPDGVSGAMFASGVGEQLSIGSGHESQTGTFPVSKELDYYLQLRAVVVPVTPATPTTLAGNAVQTVVRDQNGKYAVSISDKSGKTVLTARNGDFNANDFVLQIDNVVTASSTATSPDYKQQFDFYILNAQHVSITSTSSSAVYTVKNIVTDLELTDDEKNGVWPVGFYRVLLTSGDITTSYSNYFQDVACQFYNDAGRLMSSLSPNGFQKIKNGTDLIGDYAAADKTTYKYNHRGWLLSMTEPDAGTTRYMYRKDGSIRYSQNAKQAIGNRFSYTLYDQVNRPTESGEYKGTTFTYGSPELKSTLEYNPDANANPKFAPDLISEVNDWVRTHYDYPYGKDPNDNDPLPQNFEADAGIPSSTYPQNYIRNSVSWTENANNKTWYSYNELGRVVWMAQKPKGLPRTFVVEYLYDFLGNVLQVKQSVFLNDGTANNGSLLSTFYHHYEYDADKRLSKAYTSLDGSNKTLHASYQYYLHGPLKRIELGGNLQGIDFVYNIHGWLKSINHPDNSKDPGQDGIPGSTNKDFRPDVFGLLLDYYESEFTNLFPVASLDKTKDLERIHHLPRSSQSESLLASSSGFSMPDFLQSTSGLQTDYFKNYSAQSRLYSELVQTLSESQRSNQNDVKETQN